MEMTAWIGWALAVGGGLWMVASAVRYLWRDPLDVWGSSMQLDSRWLGGTVVVLVGVRLITELAFGWLFLLAVACWLSLVPLKSLLHKVS